MCLVVSSIRTLKLFKGPAHVFRINMRENIILIESKEPINTVIIFIIIPLASTSITIHLYYVFRVIMALYIYSL